MLHFVGLLRDEPGARCVCSANNRQAGSGKTKPENVPRKAAVDVGEEKESSGWVCHGLARL